MRLTDEQQNVVLFRDSRILVNAFAGTGKTETMAHRVSALQAEGTRVLPLCFTRAAQVQLTERLQSMGIETKVPTMHSFSHSLLRKWHERHGAKMPDLVSDRFLRSIVMEAGFNPTNSNVESIRRASTFLANGMTTGFPHSSEFDGKTARALVEEYARRKEEQNKVDYDDLIGLATEVVRPWTGEIVVDEAQDLSNLQLALLDAMTGPDTTITWVGDRFQSIYGFAGVDAELFTSRSNWSQLSLSKSFRSTKEVLKIANQLLPRPIRSDRGGGSAIAYTATSYQTTDFLLEWVKGNDAILARTKQELEQLATALTNEGIPFIRGGVDEEKPLKNRPTILSTIHSAKGLEWDRVAIIGLNGRSFGSFPATPEESRLFYVAATRARSELVMFTQDGYLPFEVEPEQ